MTTTDERLSAPLRQRAFRWLLVGRVTTALGSAVAPVALGFAVLDLTGSLTALGVVVAARSAANLAVLLLGGVLADRWPRQLVLAGSQVVAGLSQSVIAILVLTGEVSLPTLIALSIVNGLAAGLGFPASSAMVPLVVPDPLLRQANALSRMGVTSAAIGGAAIAGALVAVAGPGSGLAVDAASFLLATACFARIGLSASRPHTPGSSVVTDLREGWAEVRARRWVVVVIVQFFLVNACLQGCLVVLGPAVADQHFGRPSWGLALAALSAGLLCGGALGLRWQPDRALAWGVAVTALLALPLLALAYAPALLVVSGALLFAGVGIEQFTLAWDISLQQNIPASKLARVYSYDALGSFLAIPVGEASVGPLAQAHGLTSVLTASAVLILAATTLALTPPAIRQLRRR